MEEERSRRLGELGSGGWGGGSEGFAGQEVDDTCGGFFSKKRRSSSQELGVTVPGEVAFAPTHVRPRALFRLCSSCSERASTQVRHIRPVRIAEKPVVLHKTPLAVILLASIQLSWCRGIHPPRPHILCVISLLLSGTSVAAGGGLPVTDDPNSGVRDPGGNVILKRQNQVGHSPCRAPRPGKSAEMASISRLPQYRKHRSNRSFPPQTVCPPPTTFSAWKHSHGVFPAG